MEQILLRMLCLHIFRSYVENDKIDIIFVEIDN